MSLGPGMSGPVHFCRRLFCEPAPLSKVQQTLESVLRKDQERFSSKWNFPLIQPTHDKLTNRQPLADQISNTTLDHLGTSLGDDVKNHWQILTSSASFYTSPPRRLKAFRRLNVTVAQKTHSELMKKIQETPKKFIFENPQTSTADKKISTPNPIECHASVPSTPVKNQTSPVSSPFELGTTVHPPLIIKPVEDQHVSEFLSPFVRQSSCSSPKQVEKPVLNVIRARYSEQPVKRKSGTKVTDYFTISKRPRQSLK